MVSQHASTADEAPPGGMSDTPHPALRAFYRAVRGGDGPAARDEKTGNLILKASWVVLVFWIVSGLGIPVVIAIVAYVDPPHQDERYIPFVLAGMFLLLGAFGSFAWVTEYLLVSTNGVASKSPFLTVRWIAWQDVVEIRYCRSGTLVLVVQDETRIGINAGLAGVAEFAELLPGYLPKEVSREYRRELDLFNVLLREKVIWQLSGLWSPNTRRLMRNALRLILPSAIPFAFYNAYRPINENWTVKTFGCGCPNLDGTYPAFNANTFNTIVWLLVAGACVYIWCRSVRSIIPKPVRLLACVCGAYFILFISFVMYGKGIWL